MKLLGLALSLCLVGTAVVHAQNTTPPDAPTPQQKSEFSKLFSFSPSLGTAENQRPMTAKDKFELFARNTVNPFQIISTAAVAGIDQAADNYPSWGQGGEGYGKRFAANYADTASSEFFSTFLFPALLHQDSRYFRKETGGFSQRFGYAISRIFITRTDRGTNAPNASFWLGSLASAGLSNAYYPAADQGIGLTFERAGYDIGTSAGFNVFREFWPDINRHVFHHHKK